MTTSGQHFSFRSHLIDRLMRAPLLLSSAQTDSHYSVVFLLFLSLMESNCKVLQKNYNTDIFIFTSKSQKQFNSGSGQVLSAHIHQLFYLKYILQSLTQKHIRTSLYVINTEKKILQYIMNIEYSLQNFKGLLLYLCLSYTKV